ncbi:MAG: TIGR02584 family CRISPR-associated protein [Oscillospiraceae bacterium]|nr:TIGR02584 family CRISPR-associated protein [Oscillospiraceae bacterium]
MPETSFARRVLVSVTGMTPQVVTETLYSLLKNEGVYPTEIHLITTDLGRNRAIRDLLDPQTGQFIAFCRDYNLLGRIRFDYSMIHVIEDEAGEAIPDIRTPAENTRAADLIVRLVQGFCSDEKAAVYVSLAGGRKTMSFFAGYALSLFGRTQDRLSHVLVSAPYENNRDFFYPSQTPREIYTIQGEPLDAAKAEIALADIPFVRLRNGLSDSLVLGQTSYSQAVRDAQQLIAPPTQIRFDLTGKVKRRIICAGQIVELMPSHAAVYVWMCLRVIQGRGTYCSSENAADVCAEYLPVYEEVCNYEEREAGAGRTRVVGKYSHEDKGKTLKNADDFLQYFRERVSRINRDLQHTLGKVLAEPYLIKSDGKRHPTTYALNVAPEAITLPGGTFARLLERQNR